jgi:hypothetical protein
VIPFLLAAGLLGVLAGLTLRKVWLRRWLSRRPDAARRP